MQYLQILIGIPRDCIYFRNDRLNYNELSHPELHSSNAGNAWPWVQWLELPVWKVGNRGFEPHSCLWVQRNKMFLLRTLIKIHYCGEPQWPRGSVLGLRPLGLEFRILCLGGGGGGQCHLIHPTIVRRFSRPILAYMCTKVAWNPNYFISFPTLKNVLTSNV